MRKPPEPLHHGEIPTLPLHTAGSLIKRRGCLHELISAPAGDRQLPREVPPTSNCMGPDASGATANIARQYDKLRHSSLLELLPPPSPSLSFFRGDGPLGGTQPQREDQDEIMPTGRSVAALHRNTKMFNLSDHAPGVTVPRCSQIHHTVADLRGA